jgi:hypothetical protein
MSIMDKKICNKCGIEKDIDEFHNSNKGKFGKVSKCKICVKHYQNERKDQRKEYDRKYRLANKARIAERTSEYNKKNKEFISLRKLNWYRKNKDRINKKLSERKKIDPIFKLKTLYRSKINKILGSNREKTFDLIGCTPIQLKQHIEGQFKENMCWENHELMGWHIDHIIPLSSAKNEDELKKLCHYTNLQPLWWFENLEKRDKVLILPNNTNQPI